MTPLILLALLLPGLGLAAEPAPFSQDIQRLEGRRLELQGKLDDRLRLLLKADAKSTPGNAEASRLLRKAVDDTRKSLAVVAASLRKLREFGGMFTEFRLSPKAVFGTSWVKGDVTLATAGGVRPLTAGTVIEESGFISTGDGAANIILPDGKRLTLAPHTRFDTRSWTLYSGELYYEDLYMRARAELKQFSKKFEVRTPNFVMAVRGTKFRLTASSVTLLDGEVEVSTSATAVAPAFSGATPEPGAVLETGPEQTRALSLSGGLSVALGPESRLECSKSGKPAAFLRRGSARFRARSGTEPAQVLVPNGRSLASSADWSLRVLPSGAAELSLEASSVTMTADETRLDAAALDRWWDTPYEEP